MEHKMENRSGRCDVMLWKQGCVVVLWRTTAKRLNGFLGELFWLRVLASWCQSVNSLMKGTSSGWFYKFSFSCKTTSTPLFFFQKTHPKGQHHLQQQLHSVLQGIQELLLWAVHVCRERVRHPHHPQHASAGTWPPPPPPPPVSQLLGFRRRPSPSHRRLCFQGAAVMMESRSLFIRQLVSSTIKHFGEGAFITKPVGELMWGYDSKLVDFLQKYLPGQLPISGKFGLFSEVTAAEHGEGSKRDSRYPLQSCRLSK